MKIAKVVSGIFLLFIVIHFTRADNPIIQTIFTADPAPMVYNDTFYIYTGHDEDGSTSFTMKDWRCFSSTDMVNWTDHGVMMNLGTFSWAQSQAWAGHCIPRNGKFYYYVPVRHKDGREVIGVAVSNSPTGPFKDALGKPLVYAGKGDIDPNVFIDDNGQAHLYWGNPCLWYVKLNENMISYTGTPVNLITQPGGGVAGFGPQTEVSDNYPTSYHEAPWAYKRNDLYYMLYAAKGVPEDIRYSTSPTPTGPWTYKGIIMPAQGNSWTIHEGVVDFKGKSYFVYHNGDLEDGGSSTTRSVCVEEFTYNADGTIPEINMTKKGLNQVSHLNPYIKHQAEEICWENGIETTLSKIVGMHVTDVDNGDYIKVKGVDFGVAGAANFSANIACMSRGGSIELHLDSVTGTIIGTLPISYSGGSEQWKNEVTKVEGAVGLHDLFIVFKGLSGEDLFNFDSWKFAVKTTDHDLFAINASIDKYKIDTISGINTAKFKVIAIYTDGASEDITANAQFTLDKTGVVSINNGELKGIGYNTVNVNVTYGGKSDSLSIVVKQLTAELTVKNIVVNTYDVNLLTGAKLSYNVIANFMDGHTEDITKRVSCINLNSEIASVSNGTIKALSEGKTSVTISFKGELGEASSSPMNINVLTFPLLSKYFNPSIYSTGTFNETTHNLITGQYGYGGWAIENGLDLSGYKYLVAVLGSTNTCGASLNIFDENSYWAACYSVSFGTKTKVIVDLSKMTKTVDNKVVSCDPSHIYMVGFWTYGGTALNIKDVYLTNSSTYEKPTEIESTAIDENDNLVDVYSLMGIKIKSKVIESDIISELPDGFYLIGNKKILIKRN